MNANCDCPKADGEPSALASAALFTPAPSRIARRLHPGFAASAARARASSGCGGTVGAAQLSEPLPEPRPPRRGDSLPVRLPQGLLPGLPARRYPGRLGLALSGNSLTRAKSGTPH